jgi:hypothetical protein
MTNEALWHEIEVLPFGERLKLVERIEGTLAVDDGGTPSMTPGEFRALLDERDRAIREDPAGNMDALKAIARLQAKYA